MHIPDGYLGPATYGSLWAAMIGLWSYAARRVKRELRTSQVPYLAMASSFSFVAMIFAIPLPGGTTAHITGSALVAILLGPWAAVIAVSIALIIQALVFGDGGVTAIAANCFNIAFVGSFVGYLIYRLAIKAGEITGAVNRSDSEDLSSIKTPVQISGAALGAYAGINAAALLTALELGLQPLIYGSGTGAGYFPYPLKVALPAVVLPHLTLVGLLEAAVAALVIAFLRKSKLRITGSSMRTLLFIAAALHFQTSSASAHDYLIEQRGQDLLLFYGHGSQAMEFEDAKVSKLRAINANGKDLDVRKEKRDKALLLKVAGRPAMVMAEIDNGYWSKTIYGWKEFPKRKASRVVEAIRSLYYTEMLLSWNGAVREAAASARLRIVPLEDPFAVRPGAQLPVMIIGNGKPLPGVEVIGYDHAGRGKTDHNGVVRIPIHAGLNLVTVEYKEPIKDDPDADALSLTAALTFEVKK
jgi:cobalt/nickel transport system permease protein